MTYPIGDPSDPVEAAHRFRIHIFGAGLGSFRLSPNVDIADYIFQGTEAQVRAEARRLRHKANRLPQYDTWPEIDFYIVDEGLAPGPV